MEAINEPAYRFAIDLLELGPAGDVLEIGFGTGRMIELMLHVTSGRVAGVDPTPTMLEVARARGAVRRAAGRVDLTLGADNSLDFPPGSFDRIVALHSFQFWADPERTVTRLRGLLRDGGRLVLILRDHSRRPGDWLPNPLSRAPNEAAAASRLLENAGFSTRTLKRGRMLGLVGQMP
jgi:SAM-dependent methyltransferase